MNRIKELRKAKNITQGNLCKLICIAQPTLSGYETNSYEPDYETACKLADYFDVSLDYLLGRTDMKNEPTSYDIDSRFLDLLKARGMSLNDFDNLSDNQTDLIIGVIENFKNLHK